MSLSSKLTTKHYFYNFEANEEDLDSINSEIRNLLEITFKNLTLSYLNLNNYNPPSFANFKNDYLNYIKVQTLFISHTEIVHTFLNISLLKIIDIDLLGIL